MPVVEVEVVKATGSELEKFTQSSWFEVFIDSSRAETLVQTAPRKRAFRLGRMLQSASSSSELQWGQQFSIAFGSFADRLVVHCKQGKQACETIGSLYIALQNLPHSGVVERWYQMTRRKSNVGLLVFLRLELIAVDESPGTTATGLHRFDSLSFFPNPAELPPLLSPIPFERSDVAPRTPAAPMTIFERPDLRLVEYFCDIGVHILERDDVCRHVRRQQKEHCVLTSDWIKLLNRFPMGDYNDSVLPISEVISMCFPSGVHAYADQDDDEPYTTTPFVFSFLLANSALYCTSLLFWERVHCGDTTLSLPRAWCLVSRSGFCTQFRRVLATLYDTFDTPDGRPLAEQYIYMLCKELKTPDPGHDSIELQIAANEFVHLRLPRKRLDLPLLDFDVTVLFRLFDPWTIFKLMGYLLTESSIVFISSELTLLFPVQESLKALCFPFEWTATYIPVLPAEYVDYLESPVPFLCGVHRDCRPPAFGSHVVAVDIDFGTVHSNIQPPQLPMELFQSLRLVLLSILAPELYFARETSMGVDPPVEPQPTRAIRLQFLKLMCTLLEGYRENLFFARDNTPNFDTVSFLNTRREEDIPFLSKFIRTQTFHLFLETHVDCPNFLSDLYLYSADATRATASSIHIPLPHPLPAVARDKQFGPDYRELDFSLVQDTAPRRPQRHAETGYHTARRVSQQSLVKMKRKGSMLVEKVLREDVLWKKERSSRVYELVENLFNPHARYDSVPEHLASRRMSGLFTHDQHTVLHFHSFAEVASVTDLFQLIEWRRLFIDALRQHIGGIKSPIFLTPPSFEWLCFAVKYFLSQCVEDADYGNAFALLDLSIRVATRTPSPLSTFAMEDAASPHRSSPAAESTYIEYLRDTVKDNAMWANTAFWTYTFCLGVLQRPYDEFIDRLEPQRRHRSTSTSPQQCMLSLQDMAIDTLLPVFTSAYLTRSEWHNFVFSNLGSLFGTMHELALDAGMVDSFVLQLAFAQGLPLDRVDELVTLMGNLYKHQHHLASAMGSFRRRSRRKQSVSSLITQKRAPSTHTCALDTTYARLCRPRRLRRSLSL